MAIGNRTGVYPSAQSMVEFAHPGADPFDIFKWDDPNILNGHMESFNFREIVYFKIANLLAVDIDKITIHERECWLPSLNGTTEEHFEKASGWARSLAGIMGNHATRIQRDMSNGTTERSADNRKRMVACRKIGAALKWMWLRKFDDWSMAYLLAVCYNKETLREGWDMLEQLADDIESDAQTKDLVDPGAVPHSEAPEGDEGYSSTQELEDAFKD